MGVAFFFILSGFCLTSGYYTRIRSLSYGSYLVRRIRRIYPMHLLCFFVAVLLYAQFDPAIDICNLFLVQSWIPDPHYYFSLNAVGWYLSSLLLCYCVFPFLLRLMAGHFKAFISIFGLIMGIYVFAYLPYVQTQFSHSAESINFLTYIFPPVRVLDFTFGMILCKLYLDLRDSRVLKRLACLSPVWQTVIFCGILGLLVMSVLYYYGIPQCYVSAVWWWISEGLLIFICFAIPDGSGIFSKLLRYRGLTWFGNQSFSFYLLHMLVINVIARISNHIHGNVSPYLQLLATIALTTFLAWICEKYFVKRFEKRISSRQIQYNK